MCALVVKSCGCCLQLNKRRNVSVPAEGDDMAMGDIQEPTVSSTVSCGLFPHWKSYYNTPSRFVIIKICMLAVLLELEKLSLYECEWEVSMHAARFMSSVVLSTH